MVIHVSLDLETWGTTPGSDIRSIGACVFDPATGHVAQPDHAYLGTPGWFYVATDNPLTQITGYMNDCGERRKYRLDRTPATVQWWSEQSDEAQAAFVDPVDLKVALGKFSNWLCDLVSAPYTTSHGHTGITIWSHGASFDPPILAAAYEAVGQIVPWHYRAPRDTRTLFDVAGIDDHSAWLAQHPGPLGVSHHALDDAICQARAVCAAYARLTVPHDAMKEAFKAGYRQSSEDERNDGTPYPTWGVNKGFDKWMRERGT